MAETLALSKARQGRGVCAERGSHGLYVPQLMASTSQYSPGHTPMWLSNVLTHGAAFEEGGSGQRAMTQGRVMTDASAADHDARGAAGAPADEPARCPQWGGLLIWMYLPRS
jgi:hypothetical protein